MDDIKVNQNPKLGSLDRPNSYIGRSLPRENAKKHLDGGGQFVDDLTLPRMVHVAFLRSPFAHAEIKSINTNDAKKLMETTESALLGAIDLVEDGQALGTIGEKINSIGEENSYGVVKEYIGHGIGFEMHEEPNVLNYGEKGKGQKLKEGMIFTLDKIPL